MLFGCRPSPRGRCGSGPAPPRPAPLPRVWTRSATCRRRGGAGRRRRRRRWHWHCARGHGALAAARGARDRRVRGHRRGRGAGAGAARHEGGGLRPQRGQDRGTACLRTRPLLFLLFLCPHVRCVAPLSPSRTPGVRRPRAQGSGLEKGGCVAGFGGFLPHGPPSEMRAACIVPTHRFETWGGTGDPKKTVEGYKEGSLIQIGRGGCILLGKKKKKVVLTARQPRHPICASRVCRGVHVFRVCRPNLGSFGARIVASAVWVVSRVFGAWSPLKR